MTNDNRSSNLDQPLQFTAPAKWLLLHLHNYGGEVDYDASQELYSYSWGSLLKNGATRWHRRAISRKTFDAICRFLENLGVDEYQGLTTYGIASAGHRVAESLKVITAGIGGGLGPVLVDVDDAPPADAYDEYRAVLYVIHHCALSDVDKNELWDCADATLNRFTPERKREALAVVAMALAMRGIATGGGDA